MTRRSLVSRGRRCCPSRPSCSTQSTSPRSSGCSPSSGRETLTIIDPQAFVTVGGEENSLRDMGTPRGRAAYSRRRRRQARGGGGDFPRPARQGLSSLPLRVSAG